MHHRTSAFSLVELSIVLVILGLLTGGILAGQSLIRAAELRSVSTEYSRWITATQAFRDKYFATPGDFRDATRFWGRLSNVASCPTNSAAAVATPGACDGTGNGSLADGNFGAGLSSEAFQFWRQLALAGLIEGNYSGIAGASSIDHAVLGTNAPKAKLGNAGWAVLTQGLYGDTQVYLLDYGNLVYEFGAPVATSRVYAPALKPEEAWNIDTKLDDGRPASGMIIARHWNNACAAPDSGGAANNNYNASYRLSDNSLQCALYFRRQN